MNSMASRKFARVGLGEYHAVLDHYRPNLWMRSLVFFNAPSGFLDGHLGEWTIFSSRIGLAFT
jgi:hypothetical protein